MKTSPRLSQKSELDPPQTNAPLVDLHLCAYVHVHAYLPIICGATPGLLHLHNKNICHQHLSANIRVRCQVSLILGENAAGRAQDLTHEVNEWLVWCYIWQTLPFSYSPFPVFCTSLLILVLNTVMMVSHRFLLCGEHNFQLLSKLLQRAFQYSLLPKCREWFGY